MIVLMCVLIGLRGLIGPGKPASLAPSSLMIGAFGSIVLGTVSGPVGAWIAVAATRMRD